MKLYIFVQFRVKHKRSDSDTSTVSIFPTTLGAQCPAEPEAFFVCDKDYSFRSQRLSTVVGFL